MDVRSFRQLLSEHTDGYRGLLAAAAGQPTAIEEVSVSLSRAELDRGPSGLALAPSLVGKRVEARAAGNSATLVGVAQAWRPPAEIDDDPFWAAAWTSGLRHLAVRMPLSDRDLRAPAVTQEAALIWPTNDSDGYTWDQAVAECKSRPVPYDEIRRWAQSRLIDTHLDVRQVVAEPLILLRMLRGRESTVSAAAVAWLTRRTEDIAGLDTFDGATLAEFLSVGDPRLLPILRHHLADALHTVNEARAIIPLAYVLLGTAWVTP